MIFFLTLYARRVYFQCVVDLDKENEMEVRTVNRGWLKRQALKGKLWLKCAYHYTDDYLADAADNFGEMDHFAQVAIWPEFPKPEGYEAMPYDQQSRLYSEWRWAVRRELDGKLLLDESDFRGCGHAYSSEQGKNKGRFAIHSNLSYYYEVR